MKEKKTTGKTLKAQLFSAVAMMLVATISLGSATYAWFINNRTVAVDEMQLSVSTSASLLVALETTTADTFTKFKSTLTNTDIVGATTADAGGWTNFFANPITPASVSNVSLLSATPSFYATDNHVASGMLDQFTKLNIGATDKDVGAGPVKKLGLKFLSSSDASVYLGQELMTSIADMVKPKHTKSLLEINAMPTGSEKTAAEALYAQETTDGTVAANAIKSALRVAVVSQNNAYTVPTSGTYTGGKVTVLQFDASDALFAGNNTDYGYVANAFTDPLVEGTATAITNGNTAIRNATYINEATGKYAAVKSVDAAKHVTATQILQTVPLTAANSDYKASVSAGAVTAPTGTPTAVFDLLANAEREVDLYIWLEGTDNQCLNSLSGYNFSLVIPFASVTKP